MNFAININKILHKNSSGYVLKKDMPIDESQIYTNWLGGRTLTYGGLLNNKPSYYYGNEKIYWDGNQWGLYNNTYGTDDLYYYSTENVFYPWLVVSWSPDDGISVLKV